MMIVLLLLGAFVSLGCSIELKYGKSYFIRLYSQPDSIEFRPSYNSNVTIIWKTGDPRISADKKYRMSDIIFAIFDLNQKDSGRYIVRDRDLRKTDSYQIDVKAITLTFDRKPGEGLRITYDLKPSSCNIYFFPKSDHPSVLIVHQGRLSEGVDEFDCVGFDLMRPCGITNKVLQMTCNGRYEIRDPNNNTALLVSLNMQRIRTTFERKTGEGLSFTFDLERSSCNIYFFPESDHELTSAVEIVHKGRLQSGLDKYDCNGFELVWPCGISNEDLQMSCQGRYEIRDQNGNTAIEASLEMEPTPHEPSTIGISAGVVFSSLLCYCLKCCCCGKSASKEDGAEAEAEAEAAAALSDMNNQECDNEAVGPRPDQVSQPSGTEIHYHPPANAPPSYSEVAAFPDVHYQECDNEAVGPKPDQVSQPFGTEIHDDPPVTAPPSYSEAVFPAEQADAPPVPVLFDPGPQFDLGMTFPSAPPLSSASTYSDVYNSDKLNFL